MDKKNLRNYQIVSAIFVCILGTLLHFTYELSGENQLVASFSAINESVWEHLKLLFFPMLLSTIIGYFYCVNNKVLGTSPTGLACDGGSVKNTNNFLCGKALGIITSMLFIVIFFYTYTGIIGKSIVFVDIASFFVAVILGEYIAYKLITKKFKCNNLIGIGILVILLVCFIIFTYFPPNLEIFKDPLAIQ